MARNTELERIAEIFVGEFSLSITNQWWLDDPTTVVRGSAVGMWLDDAFVRFHAEADGVPVWDFVFGRNDARDQFVALYHDDRGVLRVFDVTLDGETWTMSRTDPDMHQRLLGRVDGGRIVGQADASDDAGATWRKDLDMIFERVT